MGQQKFLFETDISTAFDISKVESIPTKKSKRHRRSKYDGILAEISKMKKGEKLRIFPNGEKLITVASGINSLLKSRNLSKFFRIYTRDAIYILKV
jgi:hypothetical protein